MSETAAEAWTHGGDVTSRAGRHRLPKLLYLDEAGHDDKWAGQVLVGRIYGVRLRGRSHRRRHVDAASINRGDRTSSIARAQYGVLVRRLPRSTHRTC